MVTKQSPRTSSCATQEPDPEDLLRDPMIHLVMESDGVSREDMIEMLALTQRRLYNRYDRDGFPADVKQR